MKQFPVYSLDDVIEMQASTFFVLIEHALLFQSAHYLISANIASLPYMKAKEAQSFIRSLTNMGKKDEVTQERIEKDRLRLRKIFQGKL